MTVRTCVVAYLSPFKRTLLSLHLLSLHAAYTGLALGWEDCTAEFDGAAPNVMFAVDSGEKHLPVSAPQLA